MSTSGPETTVTLVGPSTPTDTTETFTATDTVATESSEAAKDTTSPTPASPQLDDEFWLEDGNLTLIAGDVEFRVYKGPLMAVSPVFKDMLSLPQPTATTGGDPSAPQCSTCGHAPQAPAVVHLSDHPCDLRHLLRVLVPGKTPRVTPEDLSFGAVSACIRLGHKYEIDQVVQSSLAYLKKHFVEGYDNWNRVDPPRPPAFQGIHCIGVVNLARMTGTDILLPTALMGCCMLEAKELMHGFAREDGCTLETLSLDDVGRCFVGRAALMEANTLATLRLLQQRLVDDCARRDVCGAVFLRMLDELRNHERVVCTLDWFKYWTDYIDARDHERQLCAPCYKGLLEREKTQHREIWRKLPELMGVTVHGWAAELPPAEPQPASEEEQT
ncbi:hypothetical protein BD413DRAFT_226579 [Trametes elegans]|nr:hypothetical protein BD413DRAFT_226579 [Trametes elegans]